jgi:hypothetical protein
MRRFLIAMKGIATADETSVTAGLPSLRQRLDAEARPVQTAAICAVVSMASLLFTGSVFGVDNHLFHLPIVHRLFNEDQFSNDAFIQSLRYYSSGIWLLLAGAERYAGDGHLLFHILLYLSRLLSFVGFVCCASLVGIRSVREVLVFCLVLCFVDILDGTSLAGHGALFVSSFGHSEVANGTILLAIYFAARAEIAIAVVFAGLTFFINAFMGVWVVLPLASVVASLLWRGRIGIRRLSAQLAVGGTLSAVLAAPVLINIFSNPDFGKAVDFNYPEFLRDYYGAHFFASASPVYGLILLLAIAIVGWLALSRLKYGEVEFKAALAGMVGLYAAGIIVPALTSSPIILNLHLLRSGLMIHMLAAMAGAALVTKWLNSEDGYESTILGPYLSFLLCIKYLFPAAAVLFAFEKSLRNRARARDTKLRAAIFVAIGVVVIPWRAMQHLELDSAATTAANEWEIVGSWSRSATSPQSVFLISIPDAVTGMPTAEARRYEALSAGSAVFEAASHRRIWVDFKRGAAIMWSPSYYAQWKPRVAAIRGLRSLNETLDFAQANHIDYVVGDCRAFEVAHIDAVFRTNDICVRESLLKEPRRSNYDVKRGSPDAAAF